MKPRAQITTAIVACLVLGTVALAQQGRGRRFRGGRGPAADRGQPPRRGVGRGRDERHAADREVIHFLLAHHDKITRRVKERPDGVETVTESDDPQIAAKIKEHVKWMDYRIREQKPIRRRDPLFAEIFKQTEKIDMQRTETADGVRVIETSDDPHVVRLIQAHAKVVSMFVKRGFAEAAKNHSVPRQVDPKIGKFTNPLIEKYGSVVNLPRAKQQPRDGSRIVVDVTQGGEPDALNPAIEKVARFTNIYRGAGAKPADVRIAVVLHGDATLNVLNPDAYAERFQTNENPNLDCLRELQRAGVEIYVCGQSLVRKDAQPADVAVVADVAVSGLTALVNLQSDGYAYMPLLK